MKKMILIQLLLLSYMFIILSVEFDDMRRIKTRGGMRQNFYHESESLTPNYYSNDIIRPPTSHPYSGYKSKKSESQMRTKYMPNYCLESKLQINIRQLKSTFQANINIEKLPQNFKLMMNQIRIGLKNVYNTKFQQMQEIIDNLSKAILDLIQQRNEAMEKKIEIQKTIETLNNRITGMQKKNKRNIDTSDFKKVNRKLQESVQLKKEILLENCRLGELNEKYLARISELQSRKVQKAAQPAFNKENQSKIDTELLRCHNRISYLQMKLNSAQKLETQLTTTNEKLKQDLNELQRQLQCCSEQLRKNKQKANQWREKALMQKQDGEIHISRQQFLLYSLKKLKENNKNLLNKILTVYNKSDEKIQRKDLLQSPNFEYEVDIFKSIRTMYEKTKGERLHTFNQVKKSQMGLDIEEVSLEIDYQNYKKCDSFDVSGLRYFRPSFFSFIEESVNPDILQSRTKNASSVSRIFIQVLRSILLSKTNEFLFSDCIEKYTRFPQFTYGWFEKFYFNIDKNNVCALEPFMQKPITQESFYRQLMNVKLDQSWEIITFRQFIIEQLSLQELYFYLMSQMLLYSKAGITKQIQFQGDFSILVEYTAAKSVLDITLSDFQSWNISFLTSKIREKIILKKNKQYIESGFFLRCLLEYYRIQRSNRYRYISKLCNQFQNSKKGLRFSSFLSIINKFTEISIQTKLKLYRDCYSLSQGTISAETIFIVCSEELIFLKHLKMKSFYRLPKIIHKPTKLGNHLYNQANSIDTKKKQQLLCLQPPDPYLYQIIIQFNKILRADSGNNFAKRIDALGVSEFSYQIQSLVRALDDRNSQIGSNILKCKHFMHYFSNSIQIVRKATYYNFYELLQQETKRKTHNFWIQFSDEDLGQIFASQIKSTFGTYEKIYRLKQQKDKIYQFRINHAAKKIQRTVKRKFIQPYLQIYTYFCNEVKQARDDDEKEKQKQKQKDTKN